MRLALFCIISIFTLRASANDLLTAYRDALAHDAVYAAARATRDAGIEKLPQARAGLLPVIGANSNTSQNRQESQLRQRNAEALSSRYNSNGWAVQLTQPVFRWQNWVAYSQGELAAAAADIQLVNAQQDLIFRISQAYFDVMFAQDSLITAQAQKKAIAEQLEAAKKNFEYGVASITDTHEAQSRYDLAAAQEIAAHSELLIKQKILRSLTGKSVSSIKLLRADATLSLPLPTDIQKWVEIAESGNVSVQLGQNALEIATREVEKQRAGHLPTLDLVASRSHAGQEHNLTLGSIQPGYDTNSSAVSLQLAIPIFAGGGTMSRTREAVALREKALADLENARSKAALDAEQSYLGITSGLAQVKAYEAAVVSSQSAFDSNRTAFSVGLRINIDVLNAQSQLYDAKQKLTKARVDTLLSLVKLKAAIGDLQEADVLAINRLLH